MTGISDGSDFCRVLARTASLRGVHGRLDDRLPDDRDVRAVRALDREQIVAPVVFTAAALVAATSLAGAVLLALPLFAPVIG